jgi:mRNA interferase RelE/StbE
MGYKVSLTNEARKELLALSKDFRERIIGALDSLSLDPFYQVKRLQGSQLFSHRVGEYRIVFTFRKSRMLILVIRIGHRRNVYRGL